MLQELIVETNLPVALEQATGAAGDFARASKAASTLRSYRTDAADLLHGASGTVSTHCQLPLTRLLPISHTWPALA
jgi:hypothetical protein